MSSAVEVLPGDIAGKALTDRSGPQDEEVAAGDQPGADIGEETLQVFLAMSLTGILRTAAP